MILALASQAQVADSVTAAASRLTDALGSSNTVGNTILTVLILFGAWLIQRVIRSLVRRQVDDEGTRYFVGKSVGYATGLVTVLSIGAVWFEAFGSLGTFLGLLTAGVAIALRDLIADLAGWLFILSRRPFEIGDRIQLGQHRGDVVDIAAFKFTILEIGNWVAADQSTGRVIHIPNAEVFRQPVANSTIEFPFVWNEVPVLITFESDWRVAKKLLGDVAQRRAGPLVAQAERALKQSPRKYLIRYPILTPTVYTDVRDSGVMLTIRYLCPPRRKRSTAEEIWEDILDLFAEQPAIDLAYPTTRTFFNAVEGKRGAREPLPSAWTGETDSQRPSASPPADDRHDPILPPPKGPALVDDT